MSSESGRSRGGYGFAGCCEEHVRVVAGVGACLADWVKRLAGHSVGLRRQ